jgi:hypothetical protein
MLGQRIDRLSTLSFLKLMLGQRVARLSTLPFFIIYVGSMSW